MFQVTLVDEDGNVHHLGSVKIGFAGQTHQVSTYESLPGSFKELGSGYFSVGTDVEYYLKLRNDVGADLRNAYLRGLRDVARDVSILDAARSEDVFQTSLLRTISINTIEHQFVRVIHGGVPLTDYTFRFFQDATDNRAGYDLDFEVKANSTPTTNIHAIIGRNGVGKTTILNNMTRAAIQLDAAAGRFEALIRHRYRDIGSTYFSSLVSVSFSAFDPFNPPEEQRDPSKGTCYFYVGLKSYSDESGSLLKSHADLTGELIDSLNICLSESGRAERWLKSIRNLETDDNFSEMGLSRLYELRGVELEELARLLLRRMSSGHAIVLLTITKLVACVDEKTLVLFDEPESHLHPPLLSALIRSLSQLLSDRNAVAIVATHSPVVLQEIPKSCVWKITRSGLSSERTRPEIETFGENVGLLTREVFGLEVMKSGFNAILTIEARRRRGYDAVLEAFDYQLGFEGRAILRSLLNSLDKDE